MLTIEDIPRSGYERVVRVTDDEVGLTGFIAVHSTVLGPSLGGLRIRPYMTEDHALADVLDLAEAMTYKAAAARLPFGGGKAVVIGNSAAIKTPELLHSFGRAVDALDGAYVTAEDVGTTVPDLAIVAESTDFVAGLPEESGGSGDPSPATARGVLASMRAVASRLDGAGLDDKRVLVQGMGKVGAELARLLSAEGADVLVSDIDEERCEGYEFVPPDVCPSTKADVFAPCALGGVLNPGSVPKLACRAVVGSANNQLSSPEVANLLIERGVVYSPDFIANAGGIINIAAEFGYSAAQVEDAIAGIADTTVEVLDASARSGISTHQAAMNVARSRLEAAPGA